MLVIIRVPGTARAERGAVYVAHKNRRALSTALPNKVVLKAVVPLANVRSCIPSAQ